MLEFALTHHRIEYPVLSDEEIRRRRREKWVLPRQAPVPYADEHYEHEDPTDVVLRYSTINHVEPPYEAQFHPGVLSTPAHFVHQ